jgi:hypothetical protein
MGGGVSLQQIPMHVDLETFRKICGGSYNDSIFHEYCRDGVMSRDKLIELAGTTDCFISLDRDATDVYGRDNLQRVLKVANTLRSRGLIIWILEEQDIDHYADPIAASMTSKFRRLLKICDGLDHSRSVLMFMTQNYINRVSGTDTNDLCQIEFNYALRQRFPERMISIMCEQDIVTNPALWKGPFSKYLGGPQAENSIPLFSDEPGIYEKQLEQLYERIIQVTRSGGIRNNGTTTSKGKSVGGGVMDSTSALGNMGSALAHVKAVAPLPQTPGLPPHSDREDAQFFQWLVRCCPEISAQKRVIYLGAFAVAGVKTVHDLAMKMKETNAFLLELGVSERDADDIALAISDLGLGYVPVRDFSNASTIESAIYAMRKSCAAMDDPELATNALACVARIATGGADFPKLLSRAGCCEPIVKVLQRNLSDTNCVLQAFLALQGVAVDDEINEKLGEINACDVVPRALQSHTDNPQIMAEGFKLISMLATNKNNTIKLGTSGGCDVVMKGLMRHFNDPLVAEQACHATYLLALGHHENIGKLGYHSACEALSKVVTLHFDKAPVAINVLKAMQIMAVEPENRNRMGKMGGPEGTVQSINAHMDDPEIVEFGTLLVSTFIVGNTRNRTLLGDINATATVEQVLFKYTEIVDSRTGELAFPNIIQHACTAVYSLAAGSPENQIKFVNLIPLLQALMQVISTGNGLHHRTANSPTYVPILPEAKEALLRITES